MDALTIATALGPVVGAVVGIAVDRAVSRKPQLVSYWGHVSTHRIPNDAGGDIIVNTHSIWVANTGRHPAHNVRVTHKHLGNINVQCFPVIEHRHEPINGGGVAILLPSLPERSQVQLQYVGIGVRTDDIMVGVYGDEGAAKIIKMVPVRAQTKFERNLRGAAQWLGAAAAVFLAIKLGAVLWRWVAAQHFF